jgi:parallel beta-helix repeat protein
MKTFIQTIAFCVMILVASPSVFATTHHVPDDFGSIQAGLDASAFGDTVLVQPGTYVENLLWPQVNGIKLIAAGDTSNTFIDGNQAGNVIFMSSEGLIDTTTLLQGFTIRNGDAYDGFGGGIRCSQSSPTISNCIISGNSSCGGGGICCLQSSPTINNSIIIGNTVYHGWVPGDGGGILCSSSSSPTISNCTISGNSAADSGGGIACTYDSNPTISNCTISGNSANKGGGIFCIEGCGPAISNCTINGNSAVWDGGGIYCDWSSPSINDCIISENSADEDGGGIYCINESSPAINNCSINGNSANAGGGIYCRNESNPTISDCTISGNSASDGGGIHCSWDSNPTISNCIISDNLADWGEGGGIRSIYQASLTITNCIISENSAYYGGGGICSNSDGSLAISSCTISGNSADGYYNSSGGGIISSSPTTISDCTINGNSADDGGGISCGGSTTISNCAVTDNIGEGIYVGDYGDPSGPDITFSDFYNNSDGDFGGDGIDPELGVMVGINANGDPCDVYSNISLDPMYVDPDNGNYHLQPDSPCIDAGDPQSPLDPDGTIADIGAFFFDTFVPEFGEDELPKSYSISPAYPNPFNPTTTISISLPQPARLNVSVFNVSGQQVAELADASFREGIHLFTFDATNLAGGVYFVRAAANGWSDVQKVVLMK